MKWLILCSMLLASSAMSQDPPCVPVEEATDAHLRIEIAQRGWDRWGCWTDVEVHATWTAPTDGGPVAYYELAIRGRGVTLKLSADYNYVAGTEHTFWWPSAADTLEGNVRAWGFEGVPGEWSEGSEVYIIEH